MPDMLGGALTRCPPRAVLVALTVTTLLTAACGRGAVVCGDPSRPPDPGDRQLHELSVDPVFAVAPLGISYTQTTDRPATWHQGVDGAAWDGAHVSALFTTTLPRPALDSLFDRFVTDAGWRLDRSGNQPPDSEQWIKELRDGAKVTLDLWPDPATNAPDHFALAANVDVPCH
jgi:hypothetical protein